MQDYAYILLLFALFVVPRLLQRFRVPTAITSLAMGLFCSMQLGLFVDDRTVALLSTFGIVSLFLFAGLDVDLSELESHAGVLVQHLVLQLACVAATAWIAAAALDLGGRAATLLALALLTPSTGFILDSLESFALSERARFWIKSKAIVTELVALTALFVTLQSRSAWDLTRSSLVLGGLIGLLPLLFWFFARVIVPRAPRSEFAFLMMTGVACGTVTYKMGVYYLVGAFVVGMAAQRLRRHVPAMSSERMLGSVEAFSSLFVPFYFFHAGLQVRAEDFSWLALGTGTAFLVFGVGLRAALIWIHRRIALRESWRESLQVSLPMTPTLVFTLVLAGILREEFEIAPHVFGGLVIYTILNSLLPALLLPAQMPDVEDELLHEKPPRALD